MLEWEKILPEWLEIMDNFRAQRLHTHVYGPRRAALMPAYKTYVIHPSPNPPTLGRLPHVSDFARFPPFRDIIKAPEEIRVDDNSFAPAFAQLPVLVVEWEKKLDAELAELVKIPVRFYSKIAPSSRTVASGSTTRALNASSIKLHLACAVFRTAYAGVFNHLEVLSASMLDRKFEYSHDDDVERSISDRYGVQFLDEAPYIIHACGLDPRAATADDMDHRDARLKCLCCEGRTLIMNWRHAV